MAIALKELWAKGPVLKTQAGAVIGTMAPCQTDGVVTETNEETKDAVCKCAAHPKGCKVNAKNVVVGPR